MNKYEEALYRIYDDIGETEIGSRRYDLELPKDMDVLKEAIEKANIYDEIQNNVEEGYCQKYCEDLYKLQKQVSDWEKSNKIIENETFKEMTDFINKLLEENSKLKKVLNVYQEFSSLENINNKYYVIHFGGGDSNVEITQEQYELLKEVEENEN